VIVRLARCAPVLVALALMTAPLTASASSTNPYPPLANLCSEIPSSEIAAALGSTEAGVPSFAAEGTPSEVSQCRYAGGDLVLYLGYVATNAPPHEGGTSTSVRALGSSGNLQTWGAPAKAAYLTFMTGSVTRPLYGTLVTQGDPTYRVSLTKLRALGGEFYALASDGFTGTDLLRYKPPAPSYQVVVINSRAPQLAVVDPVDGRVKVITLQLGANSGPPDDLAHQLAYSASSPYIYVTASTGRGMGELLEVSLATGRLFGPPIPLGLNTNPQGVVVGTGAQFAYVVEESTASLAVVDLSDRQVTAVRLGPTSADPQGVAISPNGQQVYVADNNLAQIAVLQTSNDSVSRIKLAKGTTPFALVVSPDASRLWVADSQGGTSGEISEVDLSTGRVRSLPVGPLTPTGIAITPDGSEVFVPHQWNSVTEINTKTGADTERGTSSVPVVGGAASTPDGKYVILAGAGIQFGTGLVVYDVADNDSWTLPLNQYPSFVYTVPAAASPGVTVSTLASSLNTPWRAFRSPQLAAANLAITIPLVLLVTFPSSLFNHTFQENYEEIRELTERRVRWLRRLRERYAKSTGRRFATWLFAGTLAIGALLDALLSPNFGWNGTSLLSYLATGVALLISIAIVPLVDYLYRRRRRLDIKWELHAIPLGLGVAAICVLISRLSAFEPGYFYGLVCGVVFATRLRRHEQGHVAAIGALTYLGVGLIAWFLWAAVHGPAGFAGAAPPLIFLDDLCASVFVGGIVGNVLALLPLRFTLGGSVMSWHKGVWAAVFGIAGFGVIQVLLHPEPGAVNAGNAPLITAIVLFVVFGLGSVGLHRYFLWQNRPSRKLIAATSEHQSQAPVDDEQRPDTPGAAEAGEGGAPLP